MYLYKSPYKAVTHPCLYILRWCQVINDFHFLPQNVAFAKILDFLPRLQCKNQHDKQSCCHQEAKHNSNGLEWEINHHIRNRKKLKTEMDINQICALTSCGSNTQ